MINEFSHCCFQNWNVDIQRCQWTQGLPCRTNRSRSAPRPPTPATWATSCSGKAPYTDHTRIAIRARIRTRARVIISGKSAPIIQRDSKTAFPRSSKWESTAKQRTQIDDLVYLYIAFLKRLSSVAQQARAPLSATGIVRSPCDTLLLYPIYV